MFGIQRGFGGLLGEADTIPLEKKDVRGITHWGGTILGTTNRGNPFRWPSLHLDGKWVEEDRSSEVVDSFRAMDLDALIVVGGDGSLRIAERLWRLGLPIVGVPKTIDNDVDGTLTTFGFDTAVSTATEAIDRVHSTAESHSRVMIVEVMGRNAGWIALNSGLAGGADVILIPEIPYDVNKVCDKVRRREAAGRHFSIVVVAEGATERSGTAILREKASAGTAERLGGVGAVLAQQIADLTGKETRWLSLGHLQRGGSPTAFDRLLALRFGARAVRAVAQGLFGHMVAYTPPTVSTVSLDHALAHLKLVPADSDSILTARDLDIAFGD